MITVNSLRDTITLKLSRQNSGFYLIELYSFLKQTLRFIFSNMLHQSQSSEVTMKRQVAYFGISRHSNLLHSSPPWQNPLPELSIYGDRSIAIAIDHPKRLYGDPTIDCLNAPTRAIFYLFDLVAFNTIILSLFDRCKL